MMLNELIERAQKVLNVHGNMPVEISINNGESHPVIMTGYALKDVSKEEFIEKREPIFYIGG